MEASILFLGTAGNMTAMSKRKSGGFILRSGETQLHIDPGPGALLHAIHQNVNVREHTAVLITHHHTNHMGDAGNIISAMTHNGLDKRGILYAPAAVISALSTFHTDCLEKVIIAEQGKKAAIADIEIHTLPAFHPDTMGLKLITQDFTLCYSSDTEYNKELLTAYRGADILVLNCKHPSGTKEKSLSSDDIVKILLKIRPKLAIITHFGMKMIEAKPLYEAREIQNKTGVTVIAAEDGMKLDPLSYSAESKQKRLSTFTPQASDQQDSQQ